MVRAGSAPLTGKGRKIAWAILPKPIRGGPMSNAFAGTAALVLAIAGGAAPLAAQQRASADMILTNARVYTVEARQPWAEAVAIQDGRIVAVGSEAQVGTLRTAATRAVDVGGRDREGAVEGKQVAIR